MNKKTILLIVVGLIAACLLHWNAETTSKSTNVAESKSALKIYCVNATETKVVSEDYIPESTEKEALVMELLGRLRTDTQNFSYKKAIRDTVTIKAVMFNSTNQLVISFDSNYTAMTGITEVLTRTAVVKTLCQVEGVDYVEFYVNGQPLMDSAGQPIGVMAGTDFIDNTGGETHYQQTAVITLYFANEDKNALVQSHIQVEYDGTIPLEQLIMEELISGPIEEGMYATVPANTTINKISKKDGICYVDLSSIFLEKIPDISDEIAIYSVVNSLVEMSNVNKVQFTINGELQKTYRESILFDGFFERNLDLVESVN